MLSGDVAASLISVVLCFAMPVAIVSIVTQHKQRMAQLERDKSMKGESSSEVALLREEIAKLRDTTTKYDISVEHAMQELSQRLAIVERRTQPNQLSSTEDRAPQTLKLGGGHG